MRKQKLNKSQVTLVVCVIALLVLIVQKMGVFSSGTSCTTSAQSAQPEISRTPYAQSAHPEWSRTSSAQPETSRTPHAQSAQPETSRTSSSQFELRRNVVQENTTLTFYILQGDTHKTHYCDFHIV